MSESIKSYRIRTNVGEDKFLSVNLEQDYDAFDILSLTINTNDTYRLHNSNYGVVVGRVLANNGFGIPNAKISIFIEVDNEQRAELSAIYSYRSTADANGDGVRYNLLPDDYNGGDCHQVVGTFPNKRYVLDNDDVIEVFDKYFKYTTRTNNAGDYIIMGVPVGTQTLHMDLDLSDCGILSQRPRDFVYKGYTIEQFENPNMFKTGTSLSSLSQIFSQDQNVYVQPFWGNDSLGEAIGITRADIKVEFKFEPTCVFMGSVVSDNASNGISKNCIPTEHMGDMDELTTGEGTIEMIRKTFAGNVEEFRIKGNELINGAGIWCYQIPMNLDYMVTDEFGNMVPTDNPDKGIPTRARVRFRISMNDPEYNSDNFFRPKVLVPHNPQVVGSISRENYDYNFGTATEETSFRDLFWNNVYSVKSYIPRFQKKKANPWKTVKFTGIKGCQAYGKNNPMPYNNIRIKLPFMFQVMCILIKIFIKMVGLLNLFISKIGGILASLPDSWPVKKARREAKKFTLTVIENGLCPDLDNWYFAPIQGNGKPREESDYNIMKQTLDSISKQDDPMSIDDQNDDLADTGKCLTIRTEYLISCVEMNLAQEYRVINFDFYNDWINGTLYIPRFMRYVRKKTKFLGITVARAKTRGCMDDSKIFSKSRRYTQICAMPYTTASTAQYKTISKVKYSYKNSGSNRFHRSKGTQKVVIFGKKGGIVHESETMKGQYVYYLKPCEWRSSTRKVNLFATDIILLGSLNSCDQNGIPQAFKHLTSSTYIMPTNLALTNMEEDGYLYAYGNSGTICSGENDIRKKNTKNFDNYKLAVSPLSDGSLYDELRFLSGTTTYEEETTYEGDPSDTIPITEAAGIAWNYIGPGQGKNDETNYYYPGGHFLGLSCINSQTNIKSCVNLERICEIGVNMSQRKEDVRAYNEETGEIKYEYIVPTGLISGNDIMDEDFRSMFASLNMGRLIANKTNTETGYNVYNFSYMGPTNFNGELITYIKNNGPYNKKVTTKDESDELSEYNIAGSSSRDDFDNKETDNTLTKTIEFPSADYYAFRFGLTHEEIKTYSDKHIGKFLKISGDLFYLPQYENSFYFYFGLQNGNTALDEFNKQFFSECPPKSLVDTNPEITTYNIDGFDVCKGGANVIVSANKMTPPYEVTIYKSDGTYETHENINDDIFTIFAPYGESRIVVNDSDENELSTEFFASDGAVTWYTEVYNFIERLTGPMAPNRNNYETTGGYVKITNLSIRGLEIDDSNVKIEFKNNAFPAREVPYSTTDGAIFAAIRPGTYDYNIIYSANCETLKKVIITGGTVTIDSPENLKLTMGVGDSKVDITNEIDKNWWRTTYINTDNDGATIHGWGIRKGLINGATTTAETFSNLVSAQDGSKATWMTPQNNVGYADDKSLKSSLYPDGIPDGYSVDDDASYWGTYGVEDVNPNYAAAFDEEGRVMGIHCATVNAGETGQTKTITLTPSTPRSNIVDGNACVFKPIPDGDLVPCVFRVNGNVFKIECLYQVEWDNGLVYMCSTYPIIKKPFSADCRYFFHQTMAVPIEIITDVEDRFIEGNYDSGILSALYKYTDNPASRMDVVENRLSSVNAWVKVQNGVTFSRHFAGESFIQYSIDGDAYANNFAVGDYDLKSEITGGPITNRIVLYSGATYYSPEDNEVSFSIKEGYPHYKNSSEFFAYRASSTYDEIDNWESYAAVTNEVDLNDSTTFYDNIKLVNEGPNTTMVSVGESDSDVKYYLFSGSTQVQNIPFIVSDERVISSKELPGILLTSAPATAVTYPVKIKNRTSFLTAYIVRAGTILSITQVLIPGVDSAGTFYLKWAQGHGYDTNIEEEMFGDIRSLSSTTEFLNTSAAGLTFLKQTVLKNNISREDALNMCLNGRVREIVFDDNKCEFNSNINDWSTLVIGIKKIPSNDKAEGYVCKFYHYISHDE